MKSSQLVLMTALCLLTPLNSHARWMQPGEADVEAESRNLHVAVKADGSSVYNTSTKIKVLNENGRHEWGTLRMNYSPKNVRFQVLSALAETNGVVYKVESRNIVDTPLSATETGFDEARQVLISFPQVQVGTQLSLETKQVIFHPFMQDRFFDTFWFGESHALLQSDVQLDSEIPLYLQINDPTKRLEVTKSEAKGKYHYRIHLLSPIIQQVVEEERAVLPESRLTWVAVSSSASYKVMFANMVERFEERLRDPLPAKFRPIVESAKLQKDPAAQVNTVLSMLADSVRYMGDWRAVDGAWVPRTLAQIAETQFGDCKDYSTVTTKILRELGLKAYVALTYRGVPPRNSPQVAAPAFNHAIVFVALGNQQLWVDATNFQAFANGIFEDIGDRQALVLDNQVLELRKITFKPPADNVENVSIKIQLRPGQMRHDRIDLDLLGNSAMRVTGEELRFSKERIEAATVANLTNIAEVVDYKFDPYDLKSRVVKPIHMGITVDRHFHPILTSLGSAIEFSPSDELHDLLRVDRKNREADFKLNLPGQMTTTAYLQNLVPQGKALRNCEVRSPWLDYSYSLSANPLKVVRRMEIKSYMITAAEIHSAEFTKLQEDLQSCARTRYLIFKPQ